METIQATSKPHCRLATATPGFRATKHSDAANELAEEKSRLGAKLDNEVCDFLMGPKLRGRVRAKALEDFMSRWGASR